MIVVTIQLHSAVSGQSETLGVMHIANDGTARDARQGNYDVKVGNKTHAVTHDHAAIQDKPQRSGRVENYPRLSYNVWRLVARALKSAFPEEN